MKPLEAKLLEALGGELDFLGPDMPPTIETAIAEGNLDPTTLEAYECSLNHRTQLAFSQASKHQEVILDKNYSHKVAGKTKSVAATGIHGDVGNHTESCFAVYSSRNIREETISSIVMLQR